MYPFRYERPTFQRKPENDELDIERFGITDDKKFALDLLHEKHILIVPGSGFDYSDQAHFRVVMLPEPDAIAKAISDIGDFLHKR